MGGPVGGLHAAGWLFLALGVVALRLAWQCRHTLPLCDTVVAFAAAVTTIALGGPFYDFDKGNRFMLIALVPCAMTLSYVLAQIEVRATRRAVAGVVVGATVVSAALFLRHGGRPGLSPQAYAEMQSLQKLTPPGRQTLVVARHGLEWWAAWALHTDIAQPRALNANDWTRYSTVDYLVEKRRSGEFPGMPGGPPAPMGTLPRPDPEHDWPGTSRRASLWPRFLPPDGPPSGPAGAWGPPPGGFATGPGMPLGGGPMDGPIIPAGTQLLHDGTYFRLARIDSAGGSRQ
jgi:hypothetical protein